jgi:hypothetical protein
MSRVSGWSCCASESAPTAQVRRSSRHGQGRSRGNPRYDQPTNRLNRSPDRRWPTCKSGESCFMGIRLFGSDTAVRDYFPLLRWMIFTGVTVFGFALAWYYGLFQLMMAQDRSGLCGRMGSSLAIACCCRSRIAASSSSCCLDPEAAVIHLSFRTSGSQKTLRWRKADSNSWSDLAGQWQDRNVSPSFLYAGRLACWACWERRGRPWTCSRVSRSPMQSPPCTSNPDGTVFAEEILKRGPQIRCERSDCKLHPTSLPHHVLSVRAMQLEAPT